MKRMETNEFIDRFEEKAELVKNSINRKGTYRIIKESDWQKLKREALKEFIVDDEGNEE